MSAPNFVSGGLDSNRSDICGTCPFLTRDHARSGGWCSHPENRVPPVSGWPNGFTPSVAVSGGCDLHPVRVQAARAEASR